MDTILNFLSMGGYGFYIWAAYAITGLLLIVLFLNSYIKKTSNLKKLESLKEKLQ